MLVPFATTEMQRLRDCLARLLPHLDRAQVALTGGVAIELILAERGLPGNRDTIADLDLIAGSRTAIAASIAKGIGVVSVNRKYFPSPSLIFHFSVFNSNFPGFG